MYFIHTSSRICHDLVLLPLILLCCTSFILCQDVPEETIHLTTELNQPQQLLNQPRLPRLSSDQSNDLHDGPASPATTTVAPHPWNREEYPNPLLHTYFCKNEYPTHICDPDGILDSQHKLQLTESIRRLTELKCFCDECNTETHGIAVGIALMESIYKQYMVHPSNNTQNFTEYLRQSWKLGACDNDIVILIAVHDRQWYPALGPTLEALIPKDSLRQLKVETRKTFTKGEYYQGLELFLQGIESAFRDTASEKAQANQDFLTKLATDQDSDLGYFLGISFLAFLVLVVSCVALYMLLSWHRRRDQQQKHSAGDIEKKHPVDTATDDDEDEDVVVYDRQSSNVDDDKKPSLTWSVIRDKLSSHRNAPATEAEKAVLNQEHHSTSVQPQPLAKSGDTGHHGVASDDEIEPIDIETINTNHQVDSNNQVYKETTVDINK